MEEIADKLNLSVGQFLALLGFILLLVAIPLSFSLVKRAQVLNSSAAGVNQPISVEQILRPITEPHEVPSTSPLTNLQNNLVATPTATIPTPSPTPAVNIAFGPTLNIKIAIEGRGSTNQEAKVFVGIASGAATVHPKYILTFTVDFPANGAFSGLSLAGLNPGSVYTAYIKGPAQIDSAATFTMGPTETNLSNNQPIFLLSGDLNEDNTINTTDYTLIKSLLGTTSKSANWNARADINKDGVVNNLDLAYVSKNLGKTGDSGTWYSPPPQASGSATTSGGTVGSGGYWLWMPPTVK